MDFEIDTNRDFFQFWVHPNVHSDTLHCLNWGNTNFSSQNSQNWCRYKKKIPMRIKFLNIVCFLSRHFFLENIIWMRKKNQNYFSYLSEFLDIEIVE